MARPAKSFADLSVNDAYANALKFFKLLGEHNANTYTIWDYMFWNIPQLANSDELVMAKKKHSGTKLRDFVRDSLKSLQVPARDIIMALDNKEAIADYIKRPIEQRGNRHKGKINAMTDWPIYGM